MLVLLLLATLDATVEVDRDDDDDDDDEDDEEQVWAFFEDCSVRASSDMVLSVFHQANNKLVLVSALNATQTKELPAKQTAAAK